MRPLGPMIRLTGHIGASQYKPANRTAGVLRDPLLPPLVGWGHMEESLHTVGSYILWDHRHKRNKALSKWITL